MAHGIKSGGRTKGTPNKITRAFRESVQIAFGAIGGDKAFAAWARENPTEYYKIAARLIPQELRHAGGDGQPLTVEIMRFGSHVIEGESTPVLPKP